MARPRLTIIGLGRIGGSIGLAVKKANPGIEIIGHDKESKVAGLAQKRGAVDKTEWNLLNAVDGAGLIVLALPVGGVRDALKVLSGELAGGVIVTDTASTKAPVLEWARVLPRDVHFIGGDPIIPPLASAGENGQGIEAASATLFQNAAYCLTPSPTASENAIAVVASLVQLLGAKPLFLDAQEHDGLITGSQHLAYILSATLLQATTASGGWRDLARLAGADYLNATALATRDPVRQREMMLHHRQDITRWIGASIESLQQLREAIEKGDAESIDERLKTMIEARDDWLAGRLSDQAMMPDVSELKREPLQLFLGGLVPRTPKKK